MIAGTGALLAWAIASTAHAAGDASHAVMPFFSTHLGAEILVYPGIKFLQLDRSEAEDYILPVMKLHQELFKGKTVMDIGTGCGIIALYAAKLGAKKVIATDIDPNAIDNTNDNAKRLGLKSVIETRLVDRSRPEAFSPLRPGETVDILISNPPYNLPFAQHALPGTGFSDSHTKLGLSILSGLNTHLSSDGYVMLFYRSKYLHEFIRRRAKQLGYDVEHHETELILPPDWCVLFNDHTRGLAKEEGLDPSDLLYTGLDCSTLGKSRDTRAFYERAETHQTSTTFPNLWGKKPARSSPGLILIRKEARH